MKYLMALLLLSACGKADLNYPCNFRYAPSSDNGSGCQQCFQSETDELSFMEKYVTFYGRNNQSVLNAFAQAELGPTPGQDVYPLFMQLFIAPGMPEKGVCGMETALAQRAVDFSHER